MSFQKLEVMHFLQRLMMESGCGLITLQITILTVGQMDLDPKTVDTLGRSKKEK